MFFSKKTFVDAHTMYKKNNKDQWGRECVYCEKFWINERGRKKFKRVLNHVSDKHPVEFASAEEEYNASVKAVEQSMTQEEFYAWLESQGQ